MTITDVSKKTAQSEQLIQLGYYESLGMMMWLMKHADYHSTWPLWSLDQDIVPPLMLSQFKIYLDEQQSPVGFVTWAWLDEQGKQKVLNNHCPLEEHEWTAGGHVMVNDFVAPWGHAKQIVGDLKRNVFRDQRVFSIGRAHDGSIRKVYWWKGVEYHDPVYGAKTLVDNEIM